MATYRSQGPAVILRLCCFLGLASPVHAQLMVQIAVSGSDTTAWMRCLTLAVQLLAIIMYSPKTMQNTHKRLCLIHTHRLCRISSKEVFQRFGPLRMRMCRLPPQQKDQHCPQCVQARLHSHQCCLSGSQSSAATCKTWNAHKTSCHHPPVTSCDLPNTQRCDHR